MVPSGQQDKAFCLQRPSRYFRRRQPCASRLNVGVEGDTLSAVLYGFEERLDLGPQSRNDGPRHLTQRSAGDAAIEFGYADDRITFVIDTFQAFQQPSSPIEPAITLQYCSARARRLQYRIWAPFALKNTLKQRWYR